MLKESIKQELEKCLSSVEAIRSSCDYILKKYRDNKAKEDLDEQILNSIMREELDDSVLIHSMLSRFDISVYRITLYLEEIKNQEEESIIKKYVSVFSDIIDSFNIERMDSEDDLRNTLAYMSTSIRNLICEI